jgi:hypothetical protein
MPKYKDIVLENGLRVETFYVRRSWASRIVNQVGDQIGECLYSAAGNAAGVLNDRKTLAESKPVAPDVIVQGNGRDSVLLLCPQTDAGREWIKENVTDPSAQFLGQNLAVDHRYVRGVVEGMVDSGLIVA